MNARYREKNQHETTLSISETTMRNKNVRARKETTETAKQRNTTMRWRQFNRNNRIEVRE